MWTRTALASEFRVYAARVWRVVEAQHRISTNRLAANLEDQARLEDLVEQVKPELPRDARNLHYLLAAPFRYGHTVASRFRRANETRGVFYASETETTAITEVAYWRLRFYGRSPGMQPPHTVIEHSSFSATLRTSSLLDLTADPFVRNAAQWRTDDYAECQQFATLARAASAHALRYPSARDRPDGINVAVLEPASFAERRPRMGRTWHLHMEQGRLTAFAAFPSRDRLSFTAGQFGL